MPSAPTAAPVSRRRLLQLSGASAAMLALGIDAPSVEAAPPPGTEGMFSLGVASGAPRPDGAVLWTRLAPEPLAEDGHGGMPLKEVTVRWEVATDEDFRGIVAHGRALAQPGLAHSVHPRVEGLEPGTEHFYRFRVGRELSPVGRFRTLPAAGETPESFSFGLVSCQAWYHGHFTAHRHLAAEEDLDLVVFVGDYIYEYGITETNLWRQGAEVGEAHRVEIETLEQYRLRYALFKSDPHLQAVHARAAAVAVWDDHEVQNNYTGPLSDTGIDEEDFAHRIAVAYRAFYENMPLDVAASPDGTDTDITDGFDVGSLPLLLLDSRQFRDAKPADAAEQHREDRTTLGTEQEEWVGERLAELHGDLEPAGQRRGAGADRRGQHRHVGRLPGRPSASARADGGGVEPVMLTGDIHKHVAAEIPADPDDPAAGALGVELVCTSIASDGDGAADAGTPRRGPGTST